MDNQCHLLLQTNPETYLQCRPNMILRIKFVNSSAKDLLIPIHQSLINDEHEERELDKEVEGAAVVGLNNSSDNNNSSESSNFSLSISSLISQLKSDLQRWAATKSPRASTLPNVRLIGSGRLVSGHEIVGNLFKSSSSPSSLTLHCLFDFESDAGELRTRAAAQLQQPPLMGFDRLLEMGLSRDEVQELRQQFHAIRSIDHSLDSNNSLLLPTASSTTNENPSAPFFAHTSIQVSSAVNNSSLRVEEAFWHEVLPSPSNFLDAESLLTGDLEFLAGLCIGFFFGFIAGFFIREAEVFTKSSQKGIVLGLLLNLAFGGLTTIFYFNSYKANELGFT